jgi:flagellar protein FliO/FliZ
LGRLPLGPRKWLALVEVGGKVLLLGVADQAIALLTTLDDPKQVERLARDKPSFAGLLKRVRGEREEAQP